MGVRLGDGSVVGVVVDDGDDEEWCYVDVGVGDGVGGGGSCECC